METHTSVWMKSAPPTQINLRQFGWALIPALALLVLWELGKYVARRRMSNRSGSAGPEMTQVTGA
jgi:Ca2+-transporting ATPase